MTAKYIILVICIVTVILTSSCYHVFAASSAKKKGKSSSSSSGDGSEDIHAKIQVYKEKLKKNPKNAKVLLDLGKAYQTLNMIDHSIETFYKLIDIQPSNYAITNEIAIMYNHKKMHHEAIDMFLQVLTYTSSEPSVYNNLALCYQELRQFETSQKYFLLSATLVYDDRVYHALGDLNHYLKRYVTAIEYYEQVRDLSTKTTILYNYCFPFLALKQFKRGFELYEVRLKKNYSQQMQQLERVEVPGVELWDGVEPSSRLCVIYEQGIGDNLQYFRFVLQLARSRPDDINIIYFCKDVINRLFHVDDDVTNLMVTSYLTPTMCDHKVYVMSLPYHLGISTAEDLQPHHDNYIVQDKDKAIEWKERLQPLRKKFTIGFYKSGLLASLYDKTLPIEAFETLAELDVELICLHRRQDLSDDEVEFIATHNNIHIYDDLDVETPFVDTIGILNNIDLLITTDTSIVHLAGNVGIKTWLMLGYVTEWRWSDHPTQTYWYDTVELVRMTENAPFENVIKIVKDKLVDLLNSLVDSDSSNDEL